MCSLCVSASMWRRCKRWCASGCATGRSASSAPWTPHGGAHGRRASGLGGASRRGRHRDHTGGGTACRALESARHVRRVVSSCSTRSTYSVRYCYEYLPVLVDVPRADTPLFHSARRRLVRPGAQDDRLARRLHRGADGYAGVLVGLLTALANARDLADWLNMGASVYAAGASATASVSPMAAVSAGANAQSQLLASVGAGFLFNFHPSVRAVTLEVHIIKPQNSLHIIAFLLFHVHMIEH